MKKIFDEEMNWYKGNLHTHTTISDGRVTVSECIKLYKDSGYDFLAITDHRKYFKGYKEDEFLVLSGIELDLNDFNTRKAFHITGIGIEGDISLNENGSPQEMINAIADKNGLAILAHPYWSLLTHEDVINLNNLHGIEIWNTVSETHSCRGDSTSYADVLASKGYFPLMFAVDDTHFYTTDYFGGYIMVNSSTLDAKEIIDSIRKGRFYCSRGPGIKQISIDNGKISVETSPVSQISFLTDTFYCGNRVCRKDGEFITNGEYVLNPTDRVVRIECTDVNGKKAWSQFIPICMEVF